MTDRYWDELREVARWTDPELALAQHLDREHQKAYRWYPYGDVWRQSDAYTEACAEFDRHVVHVLAAELRTGLIDEGGE